MGRANRRNQSFHTFSDKEFYDSGSSVDRTSVADAFGNKNIVLLIDLDGDGFVKPDPSDESIMEDVTDSRIKTPITFYVDTDSEEPANPAYGLWD